MKKEILNMLSIITEEEQAILDGKTLDIALYSEGENKKLDAKKLLSDMSHIELRTHTRFTHFPRHYHDFIEIMYVCSGEVTHIIGGNKLVLKQGELLFLGRNSWHEILPVSEENISVNFIIKPSFFVTAFDLMDEENPISDFIFNCLTCVGSANEFLHFKVADVLPVQNLVENLIFSLCDKELSEKNDEITMALLLQHLIKYWASSQVSTDQPRAIALQVLHYIDENYANASLHDFASQFNLPDYTISRIIKAQFGTTFRKLVMEKRLSVASSFLKKSHLTVSEIITLVGYENSSYFYRAFSERHGCTPQEYRYKKRD